MNDELSDDRVIGVAFKWSLAVLLSGLLAVALLLAARQLLQEKPAPTVDADLIAPQSLQAKPQPTPPQVRFTDVTASAGIHHSHVNGAYGERLLPETMGGGVAVLDYDNDAAIDLLFVNGRSWPWQDSTTDNSSLVLYRGDGNGKFTDVTIAAGLDTQLYGMGTAVGDFDGDGFTDIFVTAVGANRLYRNVQGQRFEDVTKSASVGGAADAWSTGAAFVDYDRDGDLDLFVLNYVRWSREIDLAADYQLTGIGRAYGPPAQFAGTQSYLYRNDGAGRFADVSAEAGIHVDNPATGLPLGKGLAVLPADINSDGWIDLIVANDTVRNFLFLNIAGTQFEEIGVGRGIAFDNTGVATGAMGIDGALLGADAGYAVAIGNFGNEMTSLYVRPPASDIFTDQAIVSGVGPVSRRAVTFGLFFFDYDLDGRQDLLQANGHVENEINVVEPSQTYAQQPQLFWNCGAACARQFIPVALPADNDLSRPLVGRGAAYADIDGDGDQDVILTQIGAPPAVLRNDQATGHNWLQVDVLNEAGTSAYGTTVEVVSGDSRQVRRIEPSRSYLSQVTATLAFGLGPVDTVDYLEVTWPDGRRLRIDGPAINTRHRVAPPRAR